MGKLTDNCSYLTISSVDYLAPWGTLLNNPITIAATVPCAASKAGNLCSRAGLVDFVWMGDNGTTVDLTPNDVPVLLGSSMAIFPGGPAGAATFVWIPTAAQVGPAPVAGKVVALVSSFATSCAGACDPLSPGDAPGTILASAPIHIGASIEAMVERVERGKLHRLLIGFGIERGRKSRVDARAVVGTGLDDFATPDVAVTAGPNEGHELERESVRVVPRGYRSDRAPPARELKIDPCDAIESVLEVRWPPGSDGKRSLIEVGRVTEDGARIDGFVIGLRNVPPTHPAFVWATGPGR